MAMWGPGMVGYSATAVSGMVAASLQAGANLAVIGVGAVGIAGGIAGAVFLAKRRSDLSGAATALEAAQGAAAGWKDERDAEKAKAERLQAQLTEEIARRREIEARTVQAKLDLTGLEKQIAENHKASIDTQKEIARSVESLVVALEFLSKQTFNTTLTEGDLA